MTYRPNYLSTVNRPPYPGDVDMPPYIPPEGVRLLGVGTMVNPQDMEDFLDASGQTSVSSWSQFTTNNGTFAGVIDQYNDIKDISGNPVLEIAWSFPGSTNLAGIAKGDDDEYIKARAQEIADFRHPTYIRLNWEANGNWYEYAARDDTGAVNPGNDPADYVAAWRRTFEIFKNIAPNAAFVWCPHTWDIIVDGGGAPIYAWDSWYPGDQYVDWIATNMYLSSAVWSYIQDGPWGLQDIADFAVAHNKPMRICEWAAGQTLGGTLPADNVDQWYQFRDWLDNNPVVREFNYFQMTGWTNGVNHRLQNYPLVAAAFNYDAVQGVAFPTQQSPQMDTPTAKADELGLIRLKGDLGGTADNPTTPTAVHKTTDETVAGVKTFTNSPVVNTAYATYKAVNPLATQYAGAGFQVYNTAATLTNAAGVQIFASIGDVGITQVSLNFDNLDKNGNYLSTLFQIICDNKQMNLFGNINGGNNYKFVNLPDPTAAQEAATKNYVDTKYAEQTALTAQLTTITHTAPAADDFAMQGITNVSPFGFVNANEGNTTLKVIANLQVRVQELETKLQALGFLA